MRKHPVTICNLGLADCCMMRDNTGMSAPDTDGPQPEQQASTEALPAIRVVAGVIRDVRGRILLARRTIGRDLAGLWEFSGGKVDPGETPDQALVRELHEELGIEAALGASLICVQQQYPHKRIALDVRHVTTWKGKPRGLDGQALAWVPPAKLPTYPMPSGDRAVVAALLQPDRYLITPAPGADSGAWLRHLTQALEAGVRRVQLRGAGTDGPAWVALVEQAVAVCRGFPDVDVLVNADVALARALGIGVHLRAAQIVELSERPLPADQLVAASCHDRTELMCAEQLGCDFAVLGPVCSTPTHPDQRGIGWSRFAALREYVSLPIYALGGMQIEDIAVARAHGGQGIAAIRALWES